MAVNADAQVRVGDVIAGKYRVEKILGRGGMGMVVAAQHLGLRELRAIKFMLPNGLRDSAAVERFRREAEAASRLKSGHAVRIHDLDRLENGAFYIVMEHLEGQDLKAIVKERGSLPLHEACSYVLQACEAIAEAHAAGIVHRDLKTGNLFLTKGPRGEPWVKVLDFGIAKVTERAGSGWFEITDTKLALGSPAFMAPEQMRSARKADARCDIWAFGVILYKLTTGVLPFDGASINQIAIRILSPERPRPPSAHNRALPALFDAIVLRCLEKERDDRFASVVEFAEALRTLVVHAPPTDANDVDASDAVTRDMTTQIRKRPAEVARRGEPGPPAADADLPERLPSFPTLLPPLSGSLAGKPSPVPPAPLVEEAPVAPEPSLSIFVDMDSMGDASTPRLSRRAAFAKTLPIPISGRPRLASAPTMPDTRMALARRGIAVSEIGADGSQRIPTPRRMEETVGASPAGRPAMRSLCGIIALSVLVGGVLGVMTFWSALQMKSCVSPSTPAAPAPPVPSP